MKAKLIAQIAAENDKIQSLQPTDEPDRIEGGYEHLQRLVWDLKQTDYNPAVLERV